MLPVFENFNAGNIYFSALIDSGTTVNVINTSVFNKLPNYIKRRMSNICPNLSSVTGHDLDVKGTVYLALRKDNRNFYTRFIVCKNFPYEAIIGANFLKSNKILLDVANSKFIYLTDTISIINNIQANKVRENIGNMKEYRNKQIQEISYLWKKLEKIETPGKKTSGEYSKFNKRRK